MKKLEESLHITLNKRCNNNCIFCMENNMQNFPLFSRKKLYALLKRGREKTDGVLFTGPEPTSNNFLANYVRFAKETGYKRIRLVTNGRRLAYLRYTMDLLRSGVNEISVSLHGPNAKIHDALTRTTGSFKQTIKGCKNLEKLSPAKPFKWYINITFTRINSPHLLDLLEIAASFKYIEGIVINAVIPQGRGLRFFNSLIASYTSLVEAFKAAVTQLELNYKQRKLKKPYITLLGIPFCLLRGYEKYANNYEPILMNSGKTSLNIRKRERYRRSFGTTCKYCKYFCICEGVWVSYIKKHGWSEFIPIKE